MKGYIDYYFNKDDQLIAMLEKNEGIVKVCNTNEHLKNPDLYERVPFKGCCDGIDIPKDFEVSYTVREYIDGYGLWN